MVKLVAISIVALVLSVFGAQAYAQTATPTPTGEATATPTTTATPTPTGEVQGTSDVTVPSGAPSTGYGTMR